MISISSDTLTAAFDVRGAELVRLADCEGHELLWNGDPTWWSGRAPLLFPIVGKVPNDEALIGGQRFPLAKHGFARTLDFTLLEKSTSSCTFELRSSPLTRNSYPFEFALTVTYAVAGATLCTRAHVSNEGDREMPLSFGYHPAFRWPLSIDERRRDYQIVFETAEPASLRVLDNELILAERRPSPLDGRTLRLHDQLFADGALIFTELESRSVTYGAAGRAFIRVDFPDMPQLGIWTKPGAPYVCIEPWCGYAAPVGYAGELKDKPGMVALAPGQSRTFSLDITAL